MKLQELHEATIGTHHVDSAMSKIISYMERELGTILIRIPGIEHYKNSLESGYGIRYVFNGMTKSIRFNWKNSSTGKSSTIMSVDYWLGTKHDPSYHITTKGASFVKCLPTIVGQIVNPQKGTHRGFSQQRFEPASLNEAKRGEWTPQAALDDFIKWMAKAPAGLGKTDFISKYHISNVGIYDTIVHDFADRFQFVARGRIKLAPDQDYEKVKKMILATADVEVQVISGGTDETFEGQDPDLPEEEHVSFSDSLDHLTGLVEGLVKGSFNALFVAGKGGTGKTQTVEDTLEKAGLADGNGYFKNTGTASANGIYRLLFKYRNDIILFDDSDGALNDQDGRNLIKAATDTKKIRKLAWSKAGIMTDEEGGEIPRDFEFQGRIIFISNLPLNKLDPDGALRTRAFVIAINPTTQEILDRMDEIVDSIRLEEGLHLSKAQRKEVLDVIKNSKRRDQASLRTLVRGLNLRASGAHNWQKLIELYA